MILRDYVKCENTPWVTYYLLTANIFIHLAVFFLGIRKETYLAFSLIPLTLDFATIHTLITHAFLHGSIMHLLFNMLGLWIFADNIEDNLGKTKFILFYFLCAIVAAGAHVFTHFNSPVPAIGASGAIAGMMGAYLYLYPQSKLKFVPLSLIIIFSEVFERLGRYSFNIPAYILIIAWFVGQVLAGIEGTSPGIAVWAHVGGFITGYIGIQLLMKNKETRGIIEDKEL